MENNLIAPRKISTLTDEEMGTAKEMYMNFVPITKIARHMNIARTSLQYYCNKYWQGERALQKAEAHQQFLDTKRLSFTKMSQGAIDIVSKAITELNERPHPPTMAEAQKATMVLEAIDRITRLDDGNPTEISAEKPVSVKELKKKIALDPFAEEVEEISYEEVTDVEHE